MQEMVLAAMFANQTRGLFAGGYTGPNNSSKFNNIDYITIASTGNAVDFGDFDCGGFSYGGGCASPTRGIIWWWICSVHKD